MCDTSNEIISSAINIFLHSVYYMHVGSNWGCFFMKRYLAYVNILLAIHTYNLTPTRIYTCTTCRSFFPPALQPYPEK